MIVNYSIMRDREALESASAVDIATLSTGVKGGLALTRAGVYGHPTLTAFRATPIFARHTASLTGSALREGGMKLVSIELVGLTAGPAVAHATLTQLGWSATAVGYYCPITATGLAAFALSLSSRSRPLR